MLKYTKPILGAIVVTLVFTIPFYFIYTAQKGFGKPVYQQPWEYKHKLSPSARQFVLSTTMPNQNDSIVPHSSTTPPNVYVKVDNLDIYIFSAFIREDYDDIEWRSLSINAWENQALDKTMLNCCYLYSDGHLVTRTVRKSDRFYLKTILRATQYDCPIPEARNLSYMISLALRTSPCSNKSSSYMIVEKPMDVVRRPNKQYVSNDSFESVTLKPGETTGSDYTVALCIKIAYGSLRPGFTIEWMEFYRKMGIDLVFGFTHDLNPDTEKIFEYYRKIGFLKTLPFEYPKPDNPKRQLGEKNEKAWNDDYIAIVDCQERLMKYTYVGLIDMDEFVVPYQENNLIALIKLLEGEHPTAGEFEFAPIMHVLDWGKSSNDSEALISQYKNHTEPLKILYKFFYSPTKTIPWTLWSHGVKMKPNYTMFHVPQSIGSISHFRNCRPEWKNGKCFTLKRLTDNGLQRHVDSHFVDRVKSVRKEVNLKTDP